MSIDTSKMSKGKADAMEIAEAGRDNLEKSFAGGLFFGNASFNSVFPFPKQDENDTEEGDKFLKDLRETFDKYIDPDLIDESGEIPDSVFEALAKIQAFAIKVPKEYGGRGLSQANYSRAGEFCGSRCGNIAALLSAHQSIGVPQPLLMYGTKEQKEKYLPKFAKGAVSAFALTEHDVGSDPAQMKTEALPTDDGHFILNGEKLWCTNGVKADTIVVMARTPNKNGKKQITAFIVDMDMEGVEVTHRCHFMGLKALYNGVVRFSNVKVPKENIILGEGRGMKVALGTLNIGRLTLPAICTGLAKACLKICREWSSSRSQWGCAIGKHEAIAAKLTHMAADIFAMESMVMLSANIVDSKSNDIRVESAMAKMWGTESTWRIVDDAMQIRSGRGYETAQSLKSRGEEPIAIERFFRDARINLIFEGSSEIMRLILAREALDPHLKVAGKVLDSRLPIKVRLKAAVKAGWFYLRWYPKQWLPSFSGIPSGVHPSLKKKLKYVRKTSKILARKLFHSMILHGPKLDKQQLLLSSLVEIGTELFIITSSVSRVQSILCEHGEAYPNGEDVLALVDCIFENSKIRINRKLSDLKDNNNKKNYKISKNILAENYRFLENIV
jgi:alkylation response protein AidB-like acyl-CoA dehydrogenase